MARPAARCAGTGRSALIIPGAIRARRHELASARHAAAAARRDVGQVEVVWAMSWVGVRVVSRLTTYPNLMGRPLFIVRSTGEGFATGQWTADGQQVNRRGCVLPDAPANVVTSLARTDPATIQRPRHTTRYRGVVSRTGPSTWDFRGGRTPGSAVSGRKSHLRKRGYTNHTRFRNAENRYNH